MPTRLFILGMNAKIYFGAYAEVPAEEATLTEMDNVRDVTVNLESAEADHTTRANAGWRATTRTLREATVEFEMVWQPEDPGFEAVKDAFLATDGLIRLLVLDQDIDEEGAQGPDGDWSITRFNKTEPLEDVQKVAVTAKLSRYIDWYESGSS